MNGACELLILAPILVPMSDNEIDLGIIHTVDGRRCFVVALRVAVNIDKNIAADRSRPSLV